MSLPDLPWLGQRLAPLLSGWFFRPLARPSAALYVDCAERLAEAADEGGQLAHDEARGLIREVLLAYPNAPLDEDEGGRLVDANQRAGQFFNKLLEAGWIQDRRTSLDERWVLISPRLRLLLRLLRDLAEDRPAELKDFAATLRALCEDLLRPGVFDPNQLTPDELRQRIKDLHERADRAIDQMHAVETLVSKQEAAQRASASAQETLDRFLVDFHAGEHMVCYDALQEAGLIPRLHSARAVVEEASFDPFVKQRLAEGLMKHLGCDEPRAYAEAERWLTRLAGQLGAIPNKQKLIDGRMADFSNLSAARYRYQTEMRGRRPEQVKAYLAAAAEAHAGKSFAALIHEPGMNLLCAEAEIYFGVDSLARARRLRPPVDLAFQIQPDESDVEAAKDEIRRRNLDILTPQRAARFIEKHLPTKGGRLSTDQFTLGVEDDFLDFLAVLAFDNGPAPGSRRPIRWRVHPLRAEFGTAPDRIPLDAQAGRLVERLTLERLS
jgi:hypothetical protein